MLASLQRVGARALVSLALGLFVVALMLVWAVHDGGYDADTWYWGALLLLAACGAVLIARGSRPRIPRLAAIALLAFALYVAWSYLSIAWAESPGDALEGSNRALLYLLVFAVMLMLPWTPEAALIALLTFAIAIGVIAVVLLARLASADHVARLVVDGRLAAPTGYFNSTAALFTIGALTATALAARRELPVLLRGLLIALACAGLQLALIVQSRGWLFTLPLIGLVAIILLPDRLRVLATLLLPVAAVLGPIRRLLDVYQSSPGPGLNHAAIQAGSAALVICAAILAGGTLMAWGEKLLQPRELAPGRRRQLGAVVASVTLAALCVGGVAATHGHPFRFIARQWRGFSHEQTVNTGSHFTDVGSGRYDFWRVGLDAFVSRPVGGLGQDNFADYYITRRRTSEEPQWPHSLELRLLTMTGVVGFLLFVAFLTAAVAAALRARRRGLPLTAAAVSAALLPLVVWLIHGSIDWFWEMPALSGPALGFLGMASALGSPVAGGPRQRSGWRERTPSSAAAGRAPSRKAPRRFPARVASSAALGLAFCAALVLLVFPYLSVREVSKASDVGLRDPQLALRELSLAADLNPLSPDPGRLAGAIALASNRLVEARQRFDQAVSREREDWFSWLGEGLAASALGERRSARHDFVIAASLNRKQPAVADALARVDTPNPLRPAAALRMLIVQ